ncbi:MAG TPA: hypothetical protein VNQ90_13890 [Chthoniobacteraceae bacterium]|nr:hypothetical protein [Chthoniobacteraceae bacterium]
MSKRFFHFRCEKRSSARWRAGGFLLLETMIGVAIFAIGVIVLARSMNHCLDADLARRHDQLALAALETRMAEIEGGAVVVGDTAEEVALEGRFNGITLKQWREPLELHDEEGELLADFYQIHLEAIWTAPYGEERRSIRFYAYSPST